MPRKTAKPTEGTVIVPGEAKDVTPPADDSGPEDPPRALATVEPTTPTRGHVAVGVGALAAMSDIEFERNLTMLKKGVERAKRVKLEIMDEDEDYGLIPGTKTPTLLKPGAEKLALAYGLVSSFEHHIRYGDNETAPPILVVVDCFLHLGSTDGPVIAQGMGASSSWEKRYRYRGAKGRTCPRCGADTVITSPRDRELPPGQKSWWCGPRDGGCGANFPAGTGEIEDQEDPGKLENVDPHELLNTLLKMAEKRANVDAVLRGTASSGLFTQDMDDDEGDGQPGSGRSGGDASGSRQRPNAGRGGQNGGGAAQSGRSGSSEPQGPFEGGPPDITIVVAEQPDSGARTVRDGHTEKRWEGPRSKLEIIGKVGNRKHTAMIFGPLAEAAAMFGIKIGDAVRLVGIVVEEIVWSEDPKVPTRKEVWGPPPTYMMEDVQVGRDGAWVSVKTAAPELPFDQSLSTPADPIAGSTSQPSAEPSSPASPPSTSPEAAASAPPTSAEPSKPAPTSTDQPADSDKPPQRTGEPGEYELVLGTLYDDIQRVVRGKTPVAVLRVLHKTTGELVMIGLSDDIDSQIGSLEEPWLQRGDEISVYGRWSPNNGWMIADTVGKPTK